MIAGLPTVEEAEVRVLFDVDRYPYFPILMDTWLGWMKTRNIQFLRPHFLGLTAENFDKLMNQFPHYLERADVKAGVLVEIYPEHADKVSLFLDMLAFILVLDEVHEATSAKIAETKPKLYHLTSPHTPNA